MKEFFNKNLRWPLIYIMGTGLTCWLMSGGLIAIGLSAPAAVTIAPIFAIPLTSAIAILNSPLLKAWKASFIVDINGSSKGMAEVSPFDGKSVITRLSLMPSVTIGAALPPTPKYQEVAREIVRQGHIGTATKVSKGLVTRFNDFFAPALRNDTADLDWNKRAELTSWEKRKAKIYDFLGPQARFNYFRNGGALSLVHDTVFYGGGGIALIAAFAAAAPPLGLVALGGFAIGKFLSPAVMTPEEAADRAFGDGCIKEIDNSDGTYCFYRAGAYYFISNGNDKAFEATTQGGLERMLKKAADKSSDIQLKPFAIIAAYGQTKRKWISAFTGKGTSYAVQGEAREGRYKSDLSASFMRPEFARGALGQGAFVMYNEDRAAFDPDTGRGYRFEVCYDPTLFPDAPIGATPICPGFVPDVSIYPFAKLDVQADQNKDDSLIQSSGEKFNDDYGRWCQQQIAAGKNKFTIAAARGIYEKTINDIYNNASALRQLGIPGYDANGKVKPEELEKVNKLKEVYSLLCREERRVGPERLVSLPIGLVETDGLLRQLQGIPGRVIIKDILDVDKVGKHVNLIHQQIMNCRDLASGDNAWARNFCAEHEGRPEDLSVTTGNTARANDIIQNQAIKDLVELWNSFGDTTRQALLAKAKTEQKNGDDTLAHALLFIRDTGDAEYPQALTRQGEMALIGPGTPRLNKILLRFQGNIDLRPQHWQQANPATINQLSL